MIIFIKVPVLKAGTSSARACVLEIYRLHDSLPVKVLSHVSSRKPFCRRRIGDDLALGNPSKLRSRIGFEFHSDLSSEHFFLLLGWRLLTSGDLVLIQRS
jgi:hypothetical protein